MQLHHIALFLCISFNFLSFARALPTETSQLFLDTNSSNDTLPWIDPRLNGGRLLDWAYKKWGEPLNVIVSALSDPFILTDEGFNNYAKSIGFSGECMGLHYGTVHEADLGDGDGRKPEQVLARQYYFPIWGTCWETAFGGNHFRAWKQNGTMANSGAWFLAVSREADSTRNHRIVRDGYNIGRDQLVNRAVAGSKSNGMWWMAEVEWREDLLKAGKDSINHGIAQDGRVAVLTVYRVPSSHFNRLDLFLWVYYIFGMFRLVL